jgi:hypothetical protein
MENLEGWRRPFEYQVPVFFLSEHPEFSTSVAIWAFILFTGNKYFYKEGKILEWNVCVFKEQFRMALREVSVPPAAIEAILSVLKYDPAGRPTPARLG